jgi:hypothetical protein
MRILLFYIFAFVQLAGVYFFTKGFLLTRYETSLSSKCNIQPQETTTTIKTTKPTNVNVDPLSCWLPRRYKRAVIILIDALRYDFAAWDNEFMPNNGKNRNSGSSSKNEDPRRFYLNHLPVIRNNLRQDRKSERQNPSIGRHSLLYRFEADPPTVTMQRLKGLTTGGMPTFIDFKDNFGTSDVVDVDNLIAQLVENKRSITFMGDDTWTDLFPEKKYFDRSFPYPSFNVKDLDTVDNGVRSHLVPEIQNKSNDWDVIIAHFLGVDHAGHTFSPRHPRMSSKLDEMNDMLTNVFNAIEDDTIVFVFGDHGMTKDGNHGGSSSQEKRAALYIHTSKNGIPLTHRGVESNNKLNEINSLWDTQEESFLLVDSTLDRNDIHDGPRTIAQIDLLPTISLLLGIPIPFENLGKIIPEMFHYNTELSSKKKSSFEQSKIDRNKTVDLHFVTCNDIQRVSKLSEALRVNALQQLRYIEVYSQTASSIPIEQFKPTIQIALKQHADASIEMQAVCGNSVVGNDNEKESVYSKYVHANRLYSKFMDKIYHDCRRQWTQFDIPLMLVGIGIFMVAVTCVFFLIFSNQMITLSTVALLTLFCVSHFSNSYIDSEKYILPFLVTTILIAYARRSFGQIEFSYHVKKRQQQQQHQQQRHQEHQNCYHHDITWWDVLACFLASFCTRIVSNVIILNAPITFFTTMVPLFCIVIVWIYLAARMHVVTWSTVLVGFFSLLAHLFLLAHWALGGIGPSSSLGIKRSWIVRNGIPRFIFACCFTSYVIIFIGRFCCPSVKSINGDKGCEGGGYRDDGDGCYTNSRRLSATSASSELREIFHRSLWVLPSMTLSMLLLGPGSPIAVLCIFIAGLCITFIQKRYSWYVHAKVIPNESTNEIGIHSVCKSCFKNCSAERYNSRSNWLNDEDVIVWWFMSTLSYFATGHASTFGAIHISAAFIGIDEFHYGLSGFMLALNTWGGPIVHTIAVGTIFGKRKNILIVNLLLNCSFFLFLLIFCIGCTNAESTRARVVFLNCSALMLLFMMLCLVILRHHLFLWAVFAPKYVFLSATHLIYLFLHVILESFQWLITPIARVGTVPHKEGK